MIVTLMVLDWSKLNLPKLKGRRGERKPLGAEPSWQTLPVTRDILGSHRQLTSRPYRVVVCDQDPVVCGVLAHALGVAFDTPMVARCFPARVQVHILGKFDLNSTLKAVADGEEFSAMALAHRTDTSRILTIVTYTGLTTDPADRDFISRAGSPIVNLAGLQTSDLGRSTPDRKANPISDPRGSQFYSINSVDEALGIADYCRTLASSFVRGQRESDMYR